MEKRLAPEEANVANISLVQNAECAVELVGIYPAQVTGGHFPVSEIAEVALGVTGVGHGNIADRWATATEERSMSQAFDAMVVTAWGRDKTVAGVAIESDIPCGAF